MNFLIYEYNDYKKIIKQRVKYLKTTKPQMTLQKISQHIEIQYTFLSKVLNSSDHHLNEDHLYKIGKFLSFVYDEIDYLLLTRSYQITQDIERKRELERKISRIQKEHHLSVTASEVSSLIGGDDLTYMMDYFAIVVHASLWIKPIQKNPSLLIPLLGISSNKLKEILFLLEKLGSIEFDKKSFAIKTIKNIRPHFAKDHPLTRTHQLMMKTFMNQKSFSFSEDKKENIFATFTTDENGFEKIKEKIKNFTKEIQEISFDNTHHGIYQLNINFVEIFKIDRTL